MATAEIRARATLDKSQFDRGLTGMGAAAKQFSGLVARMFSVGAAVSFAKSMLSTADSLGNASDALGVGVENLQALRAAAEEAGVGMQGMDDALGRITKAQAEALAGSDKFRDSFAALGVTMEQIQGQSPDKVLELIARGLVASGNSAEATAAVFDILGRTSAKTMGLLQQLGTEGLDATRQKFTELGLVMEESVVNSLDRAEERLNRFYEKVKAKTASVIVKIVDEFAFVGGLIGAGMEGVSGEQMAAYDAQMAAPAAAPVATTPSTAPAPIVKSAREIAAEKQAATDAERLAKAQEAMAYDRMGLEERRLYLMQQIAALAAQEAGTDAEKAARIEKQLELERKLEGVRAEQLKLHEQEIKTILDTRKGIFDIEGSFSEGVKNITENTGAPDARTTAWQRIGGGVGGEVRNDLRVAERALVVQEKILALVENLNERAAARNLEGHVALVAE